MSCVTSNKCLCFSPLGGVPGEAAFRQAASVWHHDTEDGARLACQEEIHQDTAISTPHTDTWKRQARTQVSHL